jgi:isopentenyl diphosphate isomerase/L-lactate dehydrogenase-like FMN-dependent dehydrogenase
LDALESIVEGMCGGSLSGGFKADIFCTAVGDKTYIMFDSGVRGASDVVKALALGAKFVFVGRLWVWGLSIMGEHGVRHVMKSLLADLDILFNVSGIQSVDQIDKSWLESYPRSYTLVQERSKL